MYLASFVQHLLFSHFKISEDHEISYIRTIDRRLRDFLFYAIAEFRVTTLSNDRWNKWVLTMRIITITITARTRKLHMWIGNK